MGDAKLLQRLRDRNHPCVFVWSIGNEIGIGRAGLFLRRTGPGKVVLRASADGLESAALSFE